MSIEFVAAEILRIYDFVEIFIPLVAPALKRKVGSAMSALSEND